MARLHLVRHARTADTGVRLTGRLPGVGLDAVGREQAENAAALLAGTRLGAVYTSPLLRCRETARFIAAPHRLDPIPYRSLIEVDYGAWSGRTLAALRRTRAWRIMEANPSRMRFPGGEALFAVQARAVAACEELAAAHDREQIVLVSHGDVIRTVIAHYLGSPLDLYERIAVDPASITAIDLGTPHPRVVAVNRGPF
jgi:probable phosphoglycerate mutase